MNYSMLRDPRERSLALASCDCSTPPCKESVYIPRYSAARLAIKASRQIEMENDFPQGEFEANFVSVNVNYDSIRFERLTESKATSTPQLISNLGGNMGFFLGISMIFGELLYLRLVPRLWGDRRLYGIRQVKTYCD